MNSEIFKFTGIRKKLISYYLIITIILSIVSLYSYYNAKVILTKSESIIIDYVYLNNLNNDVNELMTVVEKYLATKSSEDLLSYYTIYNAVQEKANEIPREAIYNIDGVMLKDIGFMMEALLLETDSAVRAKRGRVSSEYIAYFERSNEISEYIRIYINNLLNFKLEKGSQEYETITKNMSFINYLNLIIIVVSIIINIILTIIFTYSLTKPILKLSQSAERISKGDFNVEAIEIKTDDEIQVLAHAFNKMVVNIKSYIEDIKMQAEMENKLREQEVQNLKMKSLLKDAELKSLQSQINPHFLFNTLNTAAQLSMMEGADKSSEFIQNIADLFRYNLRKIDVPVPLRDEIKYVQNYMYILKTRFGKRIEFFSDIDEDILDIKIPCTIIQPIVENAFIHGLENLERNGEIHLNVSRVEDQILIKVFDNGLGMDKNQVELLLSLGSTGDDPHKKHVSGIGIYNVIDRLRLFYNVDRIQDVIEIESKIDFGTEVMLKIPYVEEVKKDAKATNS